MAFPPRWLRNFSTPEFVFGESGYNSASAERNVEANDPSGFRRNLDLLVRTAMEDGARPVLIPFVLAPEAMARKTLGDSYQAASMAVAKNNTIAREIAAKYRIPVIEISGDMIPPGGYLDHCHLNPSGDQIKAQLVAQALRTVLTTGEGCSWDAARTTGDANLR